MTVRHCSPSYAGMPTTSLGCAARSWSPGASSATRAPTWPTRSGTSRWCGYDAFADMGGRLSFSAALLDDAGDGLVLTSINGRTETRTYAKGVKSGVSEHTLSPEEEQAIAFALRSGRSARARPRAGAAARRRLGDEDVSVRPLRR